MEAYFAIKRALQISKNSPHLQQSIHLATDFQAIRDFNRSYTFFSLLSKAGSTLNHRIIVSFRWEKTLKIIKSKCNNSWLMADEQCLKLLNDMDFIFS